MKVLLFLPAVIVSAGSPPLAPLELARPTIALAVTVPTGQAALPTYEAIWTTTPIKVDGILNEEAWRVAEWTRSFVDIRGEDWPNPPLRTRAKMTWDERALYVAAEMEEPHLWATLNERDEIVWRDDDFEVFIDPDGDGLHYFEVEINPLGTILDLFLERPYDEGGSADIEWDFEGLSTAVHIDGTLNEPVDQDVGWTVEMALPWCGLKHPAAKAALPAQAPRAGDVWRVNFSRVDWPLLVENGHYRKERDLVDWNDHPEDNWAWSPQGQINMHAPETWGRLRFSSGDRPIPTGDTATDHPGTECQA